MVRSPWILPLLFFVICAAGCFTRARREAHNNDRVLRKVVLQNMNFRRPPAPGADPKVGPGGTDYRSDPVPSDRFNCEPMPALFSAIHPKTVRDCLASLDPNLELLYRLKRQAVPFLELEDADDAPECLRKELLRIPVPREIIFQSVEPMPNPYGEMHEEDNRLNCYSSRIAVEADEILGSKVPTHKLMVRIHVGAGKAPASDGDMIKLLTTWAIAPFWDEDEKLHATMMPDAICNRCMGAKSLFKNSEPLPPLWPEPVAEPSPGPSGTP